MSGTEGSPLRPGSYDRSLEVWHGEWRLVDDMLQCGACGWATPAQDEPGATTRRHWQSHVTPPARANGYHLAWYLHPACDRGKARVDGSMAQFLAMTMGPQYLRSDLPLPRRAVIQEYVDRGADMRGMGGGFDWPRIEVTVDAYESARAELLADGTVSDGADPGWVDSLWFRHVVCVAARRGTDVHHEMRRCTILNEAALVEFNFPEMDRAIRVFLDERRQTAGDDDLTDRLSDTGPAI